jgi:hypothetical protein
MNGGGFIQHMINTMRQNRALLSSKKRKHRDQHGKQRTGRTLLKFPKMEAKELEKVKRKQRFRSKAQWLIIYTFFGLFFGAMLLWIFT